MKHLNESRRCKTFGKTYQNVLQGLSGPNRDVEDRSGRSLTLTSTQLSHGSSSFGCRKIHFCFLAVAIILEEHCSNSSARESEGCTKPLTISVSESLRSRMDGSIALTEGSWLDWAPGKVAGVESSGDNGAAVVVEPGREAFSQGTALRQKNHQK